MDGTIIDKSGDIFTIWKSKYYCSLGRTRGTTSRKLFACGGFSINPPQMGIFKFIHQTMLDTRLNDGKILNLSGCKLILNDIIFK